MKDLEFVQGWLRYAHNDLISARHLCENIYPQQIEIACYHCQQSAEKVLKGYLYFKDEEPPRTHNLTELAGLCMKHDSSFSNILDICSKITPYGIIVRYPNELAVDEAKTKWLIEKAQEVYDFCIALILPFSGDCEQ
ncbi:MAG: HEPN domain-containing protein [Prevotellaceae bacterium]|jgi:HEPN domain-containing protein|nr:HEPN domain-containing protein [Prevotellaceae bacterium]